VVHTVSSADPLDDLPPGAVQALQRGLLRPDEADLGTALERCDAARELVERWQDAFFASLPEEVDLEEEARWAAEAGLRLDELEAGDEDDLERDLELDLALDPVLDQPDGQDDDEALEELAELQQLLQRGGEPADDDPRRLLPEDLVGVLERELLLLPLRVRLEALVAAADTVQGWADLLADQEKLLGHLVLAHAQDLPSPDALVHEGLARQHAQLHAASGATHPVPRPQATG
jgi:hypothetical protein